MSSIDKNHRVLGEAEQHHSMCQRQVKPASYDSIKFNSTELLILALPAHDSIVVLGVGIRLNNKSVDLSVCQSVKAK